MSTDYEFGQPGTIYDSSASLIMAVNAHPSRFNPDTHALVGQLVEQVVTLPKSSIDV